MARTASKKKWTLMMEMTEEDKAEACIATILSVAGAEALDAVLAIAEMVAVGEIEAADTDECSALRCSSSYSLAKQCTTICFGLL